jgi:hypothetical protein
MSPPVSAGRELNRTCFHPAGACSAATDDVCRSSRPAPARPLRTGRHTRTLRTCISTACWRTDCSTAARQQLTALGQPHPLPFSTELEPPTLTPCPSAYRVAATSAQCRQALDFSGSELRVPPGRSVSRISVDCTPEAWKPHKYPPTAQVQTKRNEHPVKT